MKHCVDTVNLSYCNNLSIENDIAKKWERHCGEESYYVYHTGRAGLREVCGENQNS